MPHSEQKRRWFRIAYAENALRRMLADHGLDQSALTPGEGIRAMLDFIAEYQPQHGESDELWCSWGPRGEAFEFAVSRRMLRHGHPAARVGLVFDYRLTPRRAELSGEKRVDAVRSATATDGYHAIASASPLGSRID